MSADKAYRREFLRALLESGGQLLDEYIEASDQLLSQNPDLRLVSARERSGQRLLLSNGCAATVHAERFKTEFVIAVRDGDFERRILEYVAYFHFTQRHINFAECLEIGTYEDGPFTHVYTSVPFFLPRAVNHIEMGAYRYDLIWLMPISQKEAEFVARFGAEAFEARLNASNYDYFDERADSSYLSPPQ